MPRALEQLHRLRSHQRREATLALRAAEAERERQDAKVRDLAAGVSRARLALDAGDPADLGAWSAWRLQAELAGRRERARLAQRARDVDLAAAKHRRSVQDELAIGSVLTARAEAEAEAEKRADAARMDALAARARRVA